MVNLGNLSAWITLGNDNTLAAEYAVRTVDGPSQYSREYQTTPQITTCYIESREGETFAVNWTETDNGAAHRETEIVGDVILDGVRCGSIPFKKRSPTTRIAVKSRHRVSNTSAHNFSFAKLELTDDDEHAARGGDDIGDIVLEIWNIDVLPSKNRRARRNRAAVTQFLHAEEKIHERLKKGGTHRVKFSGTVDLPDFSQQSFSERIQRNYLKRRVIFKYRSLDVLRANGIVPVEGVQPGGASPAPMVIIKVEDDFEPELPVDDAAQSIILAEPEPTLIEPMHIQPHTMDQPGHAEEQDDAASKQIKQEDMAIFSLYERHRTPQRNILEFIDLTHSDDPGSFLPTILTPARNAKRKADENSHSKTPLQHTPKRARTDLGTSAMFIDLT